MCAYNAVNGTASCANSGLLTDTLRGSLGFSGYVVSDCNAVAALTWGHKAYPTVKEASAAAVKAGVDLFCDNTKEVCWVCCARETWHWDFWSVALLM